MEVSLLISGLQVGFSIRLLRFRLTYTGQQQWISVGTVVDAVGSSGKKVSLTNYDIGCSSDVLD
jgi:hypothetical protein